MTSPSTPATPYEHPGQAAHLRALGQAAAALVMQRRHVRVHVAGLAEPFRIRVEADNGVYRAETTVPRGCNARIVTRTDASETVLVGSLVSAIMRETGTYRVHVECDGDPDVPSGVALAQRVLDASRAGALTVEALHDLGDSGVAIADALVRFAAASRVLDPAAASVAPPAAVPVEAAPDTTTPGQPESAPESADAPEAGAPPESAPAAPPRGGKGRPSRG